MLKQLTDHVPDRLGRSSLVLKIFSGSVIHGFRAACGPSRGAPYLTVLRAVIG